MTTNQSEKSVWSYNLVLCGEWIRDSPGLPRVSSRDPFESTVARWIRVQRRAYCVRKGVFNDIGIREQWRQFIHKYYTRESKWLKAERTESIPQDDWCVL
jgi:hypothetical protein